MKRRITLSIALVLSIVLVSLMSSDSTVKAQPPERFSFDTGNIPLGPHQELRVTVAAGDVNGDDPISVGFRRMEYMQTTCSSGVCKYTVSSQTTTNPIRLMPSEAAIFLAGGNDSNNIVVVRGMVLSNSRKVKVTMIVFDTETKRVVTFTNTTFDDQASQ